MNQKELRQKIVYYQAVNRVTQADIAKKCDVDLSYFNHIMNGKKIPSDVVVQKILLVVDEVK